MTNILEGAKGLIKSISCVNISLTMLKQKSQKSVKNQMKPLQALFVSALVLVFAGGAVVSPLAQADKYEQQIQALREENAKKENQSSRLSVEAKSIEDVINKLQVKISALEAQIRSNEAKSVKLNQEIKQAEEELERQRDLLGQNIRAMYLEGEISTLEMLASSKDISEFVDKQQYHNSVKTKIKSTLDKVNALKAELNKQRIALETLIKEQEAMQSQLAQQRSEQNRLLNLNQSQRNSLNKQIRSNNSRISELRREQAIANARFLGTPGSGVNCGGGYPGSSPGPWGAWGCNYPLDHSVDTWGMFNRQCVSYTAFKVAASGRTMPKWGLMHSANANDWDDLARSYRIPVDRNPRAGDVAISNSGYYGHAMYVEHVYGDGTILISQYNAGWDGRYSTNRISASGLEFIHFR